jgi:hypothetical protein
MGDRGEAPSALLGQGGTRLVCAFNRQVLGGLKVEEDVAPGEIRRHLLELEALSAPHTWETSPRGASRPDEALGRVTRSPS